MNKVSKNITTQVFRVESEHELFDAFKSSYVANTNSDNTARIISVRKKKHLVKILGEREIDGVKAYAVTVVKERNTWQARATNDGKISGILLNQGIIGDQYFLFVVPSVGCVLGFTSGLTGTIKSVAKTVLELFSNIKGHKIRLSPIPKDPQFNRIADLPPQSVLHFKIQSSALTDLSDDAPSTIKDMSTNPYLEEVEQYSFVFPVGDGPDDKLTQQSARDIVLFLSDNNDCKSLYFDYTDQNGHKQKIDFKKVFVSYSEEVSMRNKFVDEVKAVNTLSNAMSAFVNSSYHSR